MSHINKGGGRAYGKGKNLVKTLGGLHRVISRKSRSAKVLTCTIWLQWIRLQTTGTFSLYGSTPPPPPQPHTHKHTQRPPLTHHETRSHALDATARQTRCAQEMSTPTPPTSKDLRRGCMGSATLQTAHQFPAGGCSGHPDGDPQPSSPPPSPPPTQPPPPDVCPTNGCQHMGQKKEQQCNSGPMHSEWLDWSRSPRLLRHCSASPDHNTDRNLFPDWRGHESHT